MGLFVSRVAVCCLISLQSIQPVLARGCQSNVYYECEYACGCDYECGSMGTACEACLSCQIEEYTDCGCGDFSEPIVSSTLEPAKMKPSPHSAEKKTPAPEAPIAEPEVKKPAPDVAPSVLPAAPVAVPQPEKKVAPPTDDLFPGPSDPADDAPLQIEPQKKPPLGDRYGLPSAPVEPPALVSDEPTTPKQQSAEALFVEPQLNDEQSPAEETPAGEETPSEEQATESEPPAEPEKKADAFEDLFGPTEEAPVPKENKEEKPAAPYDPFGQIDPTNEFGTGNGIASSRPRMWTDSSAQFSCQANLTSVTPEFVVLETESGNRIAVPLSKLSDADLTFVKAHVHHLRLVLAREALAAQLATSWSH